MTVSLRTVHALAFAIGILTAFAWQDAGAPFWVCVAVGLAADFMAVLAASFLAAFMGLSWRT